MIDEPLPARGITPEAQEETEMRALWRNLRRLELRLEEVEKTLERAKSRKADLESVATNVHYLLQEVKRLGSSTAEPARSFPRRTAVPEDGPLKEMR